MCGCTSTTSSASSATIRRPGTSRRSPPRARSATCCAAPLEPAPGSATSSRPGRTWAWPPPASWNPPNGPKIIDSLLATQSVFRTANAKAYEMMSNLVGLAGLYRVTGNPVYLETAQTAWKDIAARRLYVTGTTSAQEHFADDSVLPGEE